MFRRLHNIETAFQYVRFVSVLIIIGSIITNGYLVYRSYQLAGRNQDRIYVLANGKALEAYASERQENLVVEANDHIKMFHHYFFTLTPDDKAIQQSITKALYLSDASAQRQYDNLRENNYYTGIIAGNVDQAVHLDSIQLETTHYPYYFRYYGRQEVTRPTSTVLRTLVTEGYMRNVPRSENNPHGFLIERWAVIENRDIRSIRR